MLPIADRHVEPLAAPGTNYLTALRHQLMISDHGSIRKSASITKTEGAMPAFPLKHVVGPTRIRELDPLSPKRYLTADRGWELSVSGAVISLKVLLLWT